MCFECAHWGLSDEDKNILKMEVEHFIIKPHKNICLSGAGLFFYSEVCSLLQEKPGSSFLTLKYYTLQAFARMFLLLQHNFRENK